VEEGGGEGEVLWGSSEVRRQLRNAVEAKISKIETGTDVGGGDAWAEEREMFARGGFLTFRDDEVPELLLPGVLTFEEGRRRWDADEKVVYEMLAADMLEPEVAMRIAARDSGGGDARAVEAVRSVTSRYVRVCA
jgi:hypothetical protein